MTSQKSNKKQIRQKITKRYIVTCLGLFVCLDPPLPETIQGIPETISSLGRNYF